jgi:AcrR family transcriptional regulator
MPRLSRAESQARTRELLIATARELFLRDGYHATSLEKVADAAGFSKGAVYSNFRNKDELCLAVLDAINADEIESALADVSRAATLEEGIARFERWAQRRLGDESWTTLEVEFALRARRDPYLRAEVGRRDKAARDAIAALLEARVDELATRPSMSTSDIAAALLSLGIGLAIQRVINPDIPVRVLGQTLRELLGAQGQRTESSVASSGR